MHVFGIALEPIRLGTIIDIRIDLSYTTLGTARLLRPALPGVILSILLLTLRAFCLNWKGRTPVRANVEPMELSEAVVFVLDSMRRKHSPVAVKIKGVRSSSTVEQALAKAVRTRLKNYWADDEIERYCNNLKVELHAVESDGNWYDVFRYYRIE